MFLNLLDFLIVLYVVCLNVLIFVVVDFLYVYSCNIIINRNKFRKIFLIVSKLFKLIFIFVVGFFVMNVVFVFIEIGVVFDEDIC